MSEQTRRQGLHQGWVIILVALGVGVLLTGFAAFAALKGRPFKYLSKEPAETLHVPRYIGWQAHTVVLIAIAGAVCALLGWLLVRRLGGDRTAARFLLGAGLFTVLVVLDDFFQFHEGVYRDLGLEEQAVFPVYGLIILSVLWFWGRPVLREDRTMMVLAGACMATSVSVDLVHVGFDGFHIVEDGAKMLGLTLWSVFLVRAAVRFVTASVPPAPGMPDVDLPTEAIPRHLPAQVSV